MRPVRLKKDNVHRLRVNPSGFGWPTCCRCWQPVEAYGSDPESKGPNGQDTEAVWAICRHKTSREWKETKVVTIPRYWSEEKKRLARSLLVFFAESAGEPMGGWVLPA